MIHFTCRGHPHILSAHKNTLEWTKDTELTLQGDCIIGVRADFDYDDVLSLTKLGGEIEVEITCCNMQFSFSCMLNTSFDDSREIVVRTTDYLSSRTLGIMSTAAACNLPEEMKLAMKNPDTVMEVTCSHVEKTTQ